MMLDDRAKLLLKALVERYIAEGQPVGSRTPSRAWGRGLSPATIRNVMADLEEAGLIISPHTSAGRIPTAKGYRLFVDTLLKVKPLDEQEVRLMRSHLDPETNPRQLLASASSLLSAITRMTGVVTLPKREQAS